MTKIEWSLIFSSRISESDQINWLLLDQLRLFTAQKDPKGHFLSTKMASNERFKDFSWRSSHAVLAASDQSRVWDRETDSLQVP